MCRTTHVDILNLGALGEVLHHSSAIEDGVNFAIHLDVLGYIAVDNTQTTAK